jgi:hypothetical protein
VSQPPDTLPSANAEFAARIIGARGQLMTDFHDRDIAVQTAVSDMTSTAEGHGLNFSDLQHIDLVTQVHEDLARFLPKLAQGLREGDLVENSLASTMTLRSLQDALLRGPVANAHPDLEECLDSGDVDFF